MSEKCHTGLTCHFPVIFEKRIVALKLLQCSLRKTNTKSGFVRGVPSVMVTVRVGLVGSQLPCGAFLVAD
jgi:hypothetical protein